VVDGRYQVVLYLHPAARCGAYRRWVKQAAEGELLGSRIGPRLRPRFEVQLPQDHGDVLLVIVGRMH
jgi:hypothetical protein